jgi:6-phospho-beta-glucosidase
MTDSHLREVRTFCRDFVKVPHDIKVTVDLEEAINGAAIILNQVRIGGWAARLRDEIFPLRWGGIGDESLGIGGLLNALRTWPFVRMAAPGILKYARDAWLLNLTNPSDLVSRAWREAGCQRVLSLCDYPHTLVREIASLAKRPDAAGQFGFIGMTHVGWIIPPAGLQLHALFNERPELMPWHREWGAFPTKWRIRMSDVEGLFNEQRPDPGSRARQLSKLVENLRDAIGMKDEEQYRELLEKRKPTWYNDVVIPALRSLLGGGPSRLVVGLPNQGRLGKMSDDVILESWTVIEKNGVHPETLPGNPPCQRDVVSFGRLRSLAFTVMKNPNRHLFARYLSSDPFVCSSTPGGDLNRLLDECMRIYARGNMKH